MGEIAVLAGTAHPALAAGICTDRGVRYAASRAGSAAAWPCCPVAAPDSANPSPMSPGSTRPGPRSRGRPAGRPGRWCTYRDRNPVPRGAARPRLTTLQRYVTPSQAAVAALMASSDPDHPGR